LPSFPVPPPTGESIMKKRLIAAAVAAMLCAAPLSMRSGS
jgi:hypothetical protein